MCPHRKKHLDENPDGKYFLKGGTRVVWDEFQLPNRWRSKLGEGLLDGKRCGATQNLGPAARQRAALSELAETELSLFGSSAPVYSRQEASQDQCQDQDTELASNQD